MDNLISKLFFVIVVFINFSSCKTDSIKYRLLKTHDEVNSELFNDGLILVTYTNFHEKCKENIYASQAICYFYAQKDTIRIISPCMKYDYEFGATVLYGTLEKTYRLSDSIMVAYDKNTEKYLDKNIPTYFGEAYVVSH